jgi:hypothetical protein
VELRAAWARSGDRASPRRDQRGRVSARVQATYLYGKLKSLALHYAKAAERGEAMLVRIGERV